RFGDYEERVVVWGRIRLKCAIIFIARLSLRRRPRLIFIKDDSHRILLANHKWPKFLIGRGEPEGPANSEIDFVPGSNYESCGNVA
ncbi:hypothetical protein BaRGS_00027104, partial [Batillaria attramentaria]